MNGCVDDTGKKQIEHWCCLENSGLGIDRDALTK